MSHGKWVGLRCLATACYRDHVVIPKSSNCYLSAPNAIYKICRDDRCQGLRRALQPISGEYDVVLIDCAPSLGLLTLNAMVAASHVLVAAVKLLAAGRPGGMLLLQDHLHLSSSISKYE